MASTSIHPRPNPNWPSWLYEKLTRDDLPKRADLIFVLAGRMERKQYGLELYGAGIAPRLLLSIGRFEVSRMRSVDFASTAELIARRDRTPADERHFFAEISASGIRIEKPRLRRWSTYGEILGLREFLQRDTPRSLILVSTDVHLCRVAVTFNRVFRDAPLEVQFCPVPASYSCLRKEGWWARPDDRACVFQEMVKLAAYRTILAMPEWVVRRLMRLKD